MVDVIDSQLNSGWIAKTNSVSNPTSLYKSGQGQVIFLKPEAQMTDVQQIQAPGINPTQFQLEAEFEKDMMEIMGISPEQLGMAENEKIETAGTLAKMRQAAGMVNLQDIMDGLRESQKILSRKIVKLIQLNYTPEKIELITKRRPTEEFYSKSFGKYDISVEEGNLTDTQKQNDFVGRLALRQIGVNITDAEIIQASNLHDKKKIFERMDQEAKQAQQVQQAQTQLMMENQQNINKSVDAKAYSDQSLGDERRARIGLDTAEYAERIARAEEEESARALNFIKAIKELQGIDMENLLKAVSIIKTLEGKTDEKVTAA
jgi:hypothetical protein